jgi:hypothetical protein
MRPAATNRCNNARQLLYITGRAMIYRVIIRRAVKEAGLPPSEAP